jgi:hypothetical protein
MSAPSLLVPGLGELEILVQPVQMSTKMKRHGVIVGMKRAKPLAVTLIAVVSIG